MRDEIVIVSPRVPRARGSSDVIRSANICMRSPHNRFALADTPSPGTRWGSVRTLAGTSAPLCVPKRYTFTIAQMSVSLRLVEQFTDLANRFSNFPFMPLTALIWRWIARAHTMFDLPCKGSLSAEIGQAVRGVFGTISALRYREGENALKAFQNF